VHVLLVAEVQKYGFCHVVKNPKTEIFTHHSLGTLEGDAIFYKTQQDFQGNRQNAQKQ
jgi:hypothetical protein